jgi:hypothetical protein
MRHVCAGDSVTKQESILHDLRLLRVSHSQGTHNIHALAAPSAESHFLELAAQRNRCRRTRAQPRASTAAPRNTLTLSQNHIYEDFVVARGCRTLAAWQHLRKSARATDNVTACSDAELAYVRG